MVRFRLLGPIKVVAKSVNCNYNCEFPKVSVVILNFFHINLDLLLVCFTIWFPDLVVLVYPFCWECTPSIVIFVVWCLPGSSSTGSWFHGWRGRLNCLVMSNLA